MKNQLLNRSYKVLAYLLMMIMMNCRECVLVGAIQTAVIDLSMYLLYLPSLMSPDSLGNFTMATEALIESDLSFYSIPVRDVTVLISSQTLDGRKAFGANTVLHAVEANVQIIIDYQGSKAVDSQAIFLLEDRIRVRLKDEWNEIRAMLMQLDPIFFSHLHFVELKPKNPGEVVEGDGNGISQKRDGVPNDVFMVFVVIGTGTCMMLLTLLSTYRLTRTIPKSGSDHGEIISSIAPNDEIMPSKRHHCHAKVELKNNQRALRSTTIISNLFLPIKESNPHKQPVGKASSTDASSSLSIKPASSQELVQKDIVDATVHKSLRGTGNQISVADTMVTSQEPKSPHTINRFRPSPINHGSTLIITDKDSSIDASIMSTMKSGSVQELMAQKYSAETALQASLSGIAKSLSVEGTMANNQVPNRPTNSRQTRPAPNDNKSKGLKSTGIGRTPKMTRKTILTRQEPQLLDKDIAIWPRKVKIRAGIEAHTQHQQKRSPTGVGNVASLTQTFNSPSNQYSPHARNTNPIKVNKGVHTGKAHAVMVVTATTPPPIMSETICRRRTDDPGVSSCPMVNFTSNTSDCDRQSCVTNDEDVPPVRTMVKHTNDHDGCSVSTLTGLGSIFSVSTMKYLAGFRDFSADQSIRSVLMLSKPQHQFTVREDVQGRDFAIFQVDYDAADDFGSVAASCPEVNDRMCDALDGLL